MLDTAWPLPALPSVTEERTQQLLLWLVLLSLPCALHIRRKLLWSMSHCSLWGRPALSTATRDSKTHRWQLSTQPAGICTSGMWWHPWRTHRISITGNWQPKRWFTEAKSDFISEKSMKQLFLLSKGRMGMAVYSDYTVTLNRWYICNKGKHVMFPLPKLLPTGISTNKQKHLSSRV